MDTNSTSLGPIKKNQVKLLGQEASRVSYESSIAFGLSSKCVKSPAGAAKEDITEMVERVHAQKCLYIYTKSSCFSR